MELQADVLRARDLEGRHRLVAIKGHFRIAGIVQERDIVSLAVGHSPIKEIQVCHRARGVVGVVQPHDLRLFSHSGGYSVQIWQPAALLVQGHPVGFSAGEQRTHVVHGVGRVRLQSDIAGLKQSQGDVSDAFLRADEC